MMCVRTGFFSTAMKTLSGIVVVTVTSVLFPGACSVGPNYVKPANTTPASTQYKETGEWKIAEGKDNLPKGKWWEIYNNAELNQLEELVNISNQNLALAEAQYRQAKALVDVSRAAYFPTLSIGASVSHSIGSNTMGKAPGTTTNTFTLPLSVSWEPDLWGKVRRTVEASEANAQASEADLESVRLLAHAEVAQDYFQLRALDQEKELLDSVVDVYKKYYELTTNRYNNGVSAKSDVLQAETQLKATQALSIDLEVQRSQLEHAIAVLIGKPVYEFSLPYVVLHLEAPVIPTGIPSELLERRPDIAAAERRLAAANAQIGVAQAAYYPKISLGVTAGVETTSVSKWLSWPSRYFVVGPSVSEALFDGGLRSAQSDQARAEFDASLATYRQTILSGFQEVEDNLAALRILQREAQVQDEVIAAARKSLDFITNQYKAGTVSYLNVIIAQSTALDSERAKSGILSRQMVASVLLIKALGGGWNASALSNNTNHPSENKTKSQESAEKKNSMTDKNK